MAGGSRPGEKALIRAAKRGSAKATESFVRANWPDAYRLAMSIVGNRASAEDVAQEALLAALVNLDSFDPGRPLKPWLHKIVVHRALDSIRSAGRCSEVELIDAPDPNNEGGYELSPDLEAALGALDERSRAVVVLRHVFGYSASEVGEMIGATEVNVRSILHRSLIQVRSRLEPAAEGPKQGGTDEQL